MKIRIHGWVILLAVVLCLTHQIQQYSIFILFLLLHELGHIMVGLLFKQKLELLEILPFGFSIQFQETYHLDESQKRNNAKKMMIALAGPAVNIVMAVFLCAINRKPIDMIYTNIWLACLNLLPIYPLDGGRILEAWLDSRFCYQRKYQWLERITKTTIIIVTLIGSILVFYYQNIAIFLGVIYLWWRIGTRVAEKTKFIPKKVLN